MKKLNKPTLLVTLAVLAGAAWFHFTRQPVPALVTSLVGVLANAWLPQLLSRTKVTIKIGDSDPPTVTINTAKTDPAPPPTPKNT